MKHNERIKLAREIAKKIAKKHGKDIISIGICGSTARNEDEEFSDLELIVITRRKRFVKDYIIRNVKILEKAIPIRKAIKIIKDVNMEWPLNLSILLHQKVLIGKKSIIQKFRQEIKETGKRENDFERACRKLNFFMYESLCKIKNAAKSRSTAEMLVPLAFFTIQANLFVGLLNKHIYQRQYFGAFQEAKRLKKLPKEYATLMNILYENKDVNSVEKAAAKLYENCIRLLE